MSDRFLLAVARSATGSAALAALTPAFPDWRHYPVGQNVMLLAAPATRVIAWAEGLIVGSIFTRGSRSSCDTWSPLDAAAVTNSGGNMLTDIYWGSYVACLATAADELRIVRAPFGDLPCLWSASADLLLLASDTDALSAAGVAARPSPDRVGDYLARPDFLGQATCLGGVDELRGGDALRVSGSRAPRSETLWSPWRFANAAGMALADPDEAAGRLRDAVRLSVAARTAGHARSLLLLSGGIDSSIVAACLADAGRDFACLNFVSSNAGDEKHYAQMVADFCHVPMMLGERTSAGVDLLRSAAAGQPRPVARAFAQESLRLSHQAAAACDASAIIDGGGGDSVFYAYLSAAPAAELWQREGWSPRFREKVAALATLSGVSKARVTARAIARSWRPSTVNRSPLLEFLSPGACERAKNAAPHPWLVAPRGIGPGTASYVATLPPIQALVETQDPRGTTASIAPLVTQPVVETCLRIPSWAWFEAWNSRVVARRAFADALPQAIIARRSKGTPEAFVAGIFEARRPQIANMLLDGALAGMGLLDTTALRSALDGNRMTRGYAFNRIMRLVDAEAWVRSWTGSGGSR